jgi:hypothetical protein
MRADCHQWIGCQLGKLVPGHALGFADCGDVDAVAPRQLTHDVAHLAIALAASDKGGCRHDICPPPTRR